MPNKPIEVSQEKEEIVLNAIREGCSYTEMMRTLRVSERVILYVKRKHGMLPPNPKNPDRW